MPLRLLLRMNAHFAALKGSDVFVALLGRAVVANHLIVVPAHLLVLERLVLDAVADPTGLQLRVYLVS